MRALLALGTLTAAVLLGGPTPAFAESWQLHRVCTPTDRCPIVGSDQDVALLFVSDHPTRIECVFAGAEIVREEGWRMRCQGAQRYDLYRLVLLARGEGLDVLEKVLLSSHETERACYSAAGRVPATAAVSWRSEPAIASVRCFAVGEIVDDVSVRTRAR